MMVLAAALSCLDPVLSVVTALENKSPFCLTTRAKESAAAMDRMAADTASDHLAVANAVACWDGLQVGTRAISSTETGENKTSLNWRSQR